MRPIAVTYILIVPFLFGSTLYAQWSQVFAVSSNRSVGALIAIDGYLLAGSYEYIFRSQDDGDSWDSVATLPTFEVVDFAVIGSSVFATTSWICLLCEEWHECVFRSDDAGRTWNGLFSYPIGVTEIAVCNGTVFIYPRPQLYRSDNLGVIWTPIELDTCISSGLSSLASNGNVLYATSGRGVVCQSVDQGYSWTASSEGLPDAWIYALAANDTLVFAGPYRMGIYRKPADSGLWENTSHGITEGAGIATFCFYGQNLFAASYEPLYTSRVYLSVDNGDTWHDVSVGLPLQKHDRIEVLTVTDNYLFAGGNIGIWRRPLDEMLTSEGRVRPVGFALHQNYPNPFNQASTIRYDLLHDCEVFLSVYNILGQKVEVLASGPQLAGKYQVSFSTYRLPSGIYIARLTTPGYSKAIKMVLLK